MAGRFDRVDGFLGRLVFRAFGMLCVLVALISAYLAWRHATDWDTGSSVPALLFALAAVAAAGCVPYCFSHKRTFGEALDAMEGGTYDNARRPPGADSR